MTQIHDTRIRRRHDGSIDTGFYADRGRRLRSERARDLFTAEEPAPRRPFWRIRAPR